MNSSSSHPTEPEGVFPVIGRAILAYGISTLLAFCGSAGVNGAEWELLFNQRLALVHFTRHPDESADDMHFEPEPPMKYAYFIDKHDKQEQRISTRISLALALGNTVLLMCGAYRWLRYRLQISQDSSWIFGVFLVVPLFLSMMWRVGYKMRRWYAQSRFRQLQRARINVVYAPAWNVPLRLVATEDMALLPCLQGAVQRITDPWSASLVKCASNPFPPIESCWFYLEGHRLSSEQLTHPLSQTLHQFGLVDFRKRTLTLTLLDGRIPSFLMGLHPRFGVLSVVRVLHRLDSRVVKQMLSYVR